MENKKLHRIKTITEFHKLRGLPKPEHPLVSIINYSDIKLLPDRDVNWVLDFYHISLKRGLSGKLKYGQVEYDFDEGVMFFIAPRQVFSIERPSVSREKSGWMLLVHPDFLWNTVLVKTIREYAYFGYSVHEALFLSGREEATMLVIINHIRQEYHANIDKFSQQIIISHIQTLLNYAERFYERQFITRKITNHQVLQRLEEVLNTCFERDNLAEKGVPTVQAVSELLNLSTSYLSSLLNVLTGQSTQQHIHEKLVEIAKEKLSATDLSVSEIAYGLGFDYPQTFSKLFKSKTDFSPLKFRKSFRQ